MTAVFSIIQPLRIDPASSPIRNSPYLKRESWVGVLRINAIFGSFEMSNRPERMLAKPLMGWIDTVSDLEGIASESQICIQSPQNSLEFLLVILSEPLENLITIRSRDRMNFSTMENDAVDESKLILCCALCCANVSIYPTCDCFGCSGKVSAVVIRAQRLLSLCCTF